MNGSQVGAQGLTRADIDALFETSEDVLIEECYRKILRRDVDSGGLGHYSKLLSSGAGKKRIVVDLLASKEARGRHKNIKQLLQYARFRSVYKFFRPLHNDTIGELDKKIDALTATVNTLAGLRSNGGFLETNTAVYLKYAVRVRGGLGDALIIARFIRDLQNALGGNVRFDVYFHSPEAVRFVFLNIPGFLEIYGEESYYDSRRKYAFALDCNQYVSFDRDVSDWLIINKFPKEARVIHQVYRITLKNRSESSLYIDNLPHLDGAFANREVIRGHVRYRYLHHMAGLSYGGDTFPLPLPEPPVEVKGKPYIVIHDGWDNAFELDCNRPTKAIPFDFWVALVSALKEKYPGYSVVQIGGTKGEDVPNIDINFRGKIGFAKAISVLKGAALHIDSESGLVHFASALGVRSVVLFGPTNIHWFGYSNNINVPPASCGNCWWSTKDWMDRCPAGYSPPGCTQHSVESVMVHIGQLQIKGE